MFETTWNSISSPRSPFEHILPSISNKSQCLSGAGTWWAWRHFFFPLVQHGPHTCVIHYICAQLHPSGWCETIWERRGREPKKGSSIPSIGSHELVHPRCYPSLFTLMLPFNFKRHTPTEFETTVGIPCTISSPLVAICVTGLTIFFNALARVTCLEFIISKMAMSMFLARDVRCCDHVTAIADVPHRVAGELGEFDLTTGRFKPVQIYSYPKHSAVKFYNIITSPNCWPSFKNVVNKAQSVIRGEFEERRLMHEWWWWHEQFRCSTWNKDYSTAKFVFWGYLYPKTFSSQTWNETKTVGWHSNNISQCRSSSYGI